ncbi:hypothetical protein B0H67DRAFT_576907 [Lasiosphaeris hirsuta]|uniref:Uncharacterized protein n=1 Tax=Lasiosphaeris hirsuta TaxID=260670 RepID=A0AA40E0P4_9PEZI|nr:hypothetical protein B0H67DRAFT_576907 [Lasiosphaeris hirsuta]
MPSPAGVPAGYLLVAHPYRHAAIDSDKFRAHLAATHCFSRTAAESGKTGPARSGPLASAFR